MALQDHILSWPLSSSLVCAHMGTQHTYTHTCTHAHTVYCTSYGFQTGYNTWLFKLAGCWSQIALRFESWSPTDELTNNLFLNFFVLQLPLQKEPLVA